jgi:hypothetical protein
MNLKFWNLFQEWSIILETTLKSNGGTVKGGLRMRADPEVPRGGPVV